jgi:uncharacterized membrane protein
MNRIFSRPVGVPAILLLLSGLTIAVAAVEAIQALTGSLPPESLRFADTPLSFVSHTVTGVVFGILGPIQFGRVLARKYGRIHRIMGRVFVAAGAFLSISSLSLMWHFPDGDSALINTARLVFGIALGVTLTLSMLRVRARNIPRHRDWMIRAYAIGMGATIVSIVFIPIFVITGEPPTGITADIAFIGAWAACVVFAEAVIYRINAPQRNIA